MQPLTEDGATHSELTEPQLACEVGTITQRSKYYLRKYFFYYYYYYYHCDFEVVDLSVSLSLDDSVDNIGALLQRGVLYTRQGQHNAAARDFHRAITILQHARDKEKKTQNGKELRNEAQGSDPSNADRASSSNRDTRDYATASLFALPNDEGLAQLVVFATCQLGLISMLDLNDFHAAEGYFSSAVDMDSNYTSALLYRQGANAPFGLLYFLFSLSSCALFMFIAVI